MPFDDVRDNEGAMTRRIENIAGVAAVIWGQAVGLVPARAADAAGSDVGERSPAQFRALLRDAARAVLNALDRLETSALRASARGARSRAHSQEALLSVMLAIAQGERASAPPLQQRGWSPDAPRVPRGWGGGADEDVDEKVADENENENENEGALPESVRPHIAVFRRGQVAVELGDKCLYFLPSPTPRSRMLALAVVEQVLLALGGVAAHAHSAAAREWHRDAALPLIHRLWPSMLPRLGDRSVAVRVRAFAVLAAFVRAAGGFMAGRFVDSAWPVLRAELEQAARERRGSSHASVSLLLDWPRPARAGAAVPPAVDAFMMRARATPGAADAAPATELGAGSRTLALRALLALLDALRLVCGVAYIVRCGSDVAAQIATACVPLLRSAEASSSADSSTSGEVREGATLVLDALAEIDGDCVCAALCAAQEEEALVDAQRRTRRPKPVAATKAKASAHTRSAYAAAIAAMQQRVKETRRAPAGGGETSH